MSSHDGSSGGPSRALRKGHDRPEYMTVGSGSASDSAAQLQAMIDEDSGYGGSIADSDFESWSRSLRTDSPMPSHTPMIPGEDNPAAENERRMLASHVHQLYYNQNRTTLGRAITRTVETLKRLQEMNAQWPAHYPSVARPDAVPAHLQSRPGLQSTTSHSGEAKSSAQHRPQALKRAETSAGDDGSKAESSAAAAQRPAPEPRLVTPQLAQDFSILKIDLKMGGLNQTELVHSLEKASIASLLDGQINKSIHHLHSLRERIEDTSSKVLVTGDLNAGKSTFCNALLRRKVLPEDQQPCTSIFCEVLDVRENGGVEEVHAIPHGVVYNRDNESTYRVFLLKDLEQIVIDNDRWAQCKIYIRDIRTVDESLLNNGVVDIALIDAPGLNNDSLKTTAVFARQEEIDVVVFVVSAANHFTLSAKEFIFNAAREKAYMFMVVNGFDNIRDKKRCQEMILKQIHQLSPATFKESAELVHFVSSNAIPTASGGGGPPGGPSGGSGGSGSGDGPGFKDPADNSDDDENENSNPASKHGEPGSPPPESMDKGKGKDKEKMRDFADLEQSLRRFVLEKRARSKLAPARTYLMNLLSDLHSLANVNAGVAQTELDRVTRELSDLEPVFESSKRARAEAGDDIDQTIENTASDVYSKTRDVLNGTIADVATRDLGVSYPGLFSAFDYADEIKTAMLDEISATVASCEDTARDETVQGVNRIRSLGILHLGEDYTELTFRSERMFTKKRDALARQIDLDVEVWDFFDVTSFWERQEKVASTSMAVTVAGVLGGRMMGGVGWVDGALGTAKVLGSQNLRKMIVPGLILTAILGVSYALASIPQSLPRRLSSKLSTQLAGLDYVHTNAMRISHEVRAALKFPANKLRVGLEHNVEKLRAQREATSKTRAESEVARKYFSNLLRESAEIRSGVQRVDIDGPAPGTMQAPSLAASGSSSG